MIKAQLVVKKDPFKCLEALKRGLRNKVIRIAMNAASAPVKEAVINAAPSNTGTLKKSIRIRIRNYQNKDVWVSIIGASSKTKFTLQRKSKNRAGKYYRPARIIHILERGSRKMAGKNFLSNIKGSVSQQFQTILQQKVSEQLSEILSTA